LASPAVRICRGETGSTTPRRREGSASRWWKSSGEGSAAAAPPAAAAPARGEGYPARAALGEGEGEGREGRRWLALSGGEGGPTGGEGYGRHRGRSGAGVERERGAAAWVEEEVRRET